MFIEILNNISPILEVSSDSSIIYLIEFKNTIESSVYVKSPLPHYWGRIEYYYLGDVLLERDGIYMKLPTKRIERVPSNEVGRIIAKVLYEYQVCLTYPEFCDVIQYLYKCRFEYNKFGLEIILIELLEDMEIIEKEIVLSDVLDIKGFITFGAGYIWMYFIWSYFFED